MTGSSRLHEVQQELEGTEARREALLVQLAEVNDQAKFDSQRCKHLESEVRHPSSQARFRIFVLSRHALSAKSKLLQEAGTAEELAARLQIPRNDQALLPSVSMLKSTAGTRRRQFLAGRNTHKISPIHKRGSAVYPESCGGPGGIKHSIADTKQDECNCHAHHVSHGCFTQGYFPSSAQIAI